MTASFELNNQTIETFKDKKSLCEKYLTLGERWWIFDTIDLWKNNIVYKNPSLVTGLLCVLDTLYEQNTWQRESSLPTLTTIQEVKKRVITKHLEHIQQQKQNWSLTQRQNEVYAHEVQECETLLAKNEQWDTITRWWIDMAFQPERRQQLQQQSTDALLHTTMGHAIGFIPKKNDMILQNLQANEPFVWFLDSYKDQITLLKPLLTVLKDTASRAEQLEILTSLLVCRPDSSQIQKLVALAGQWKQTNNYYAFVKEINWMILTYTGKPEQQHSTAAFDTATAIQKSDEYIDDLYDNHEKVWLQHIIWPNWILLDHYILIYNFATRNTGTNLFDVLQNT